MASKGQKFKKHDNKIKEEIICKLQSGTSSYYLSEKYSVNVKYFCGFYTLLKLCLKGIKKGKSLF